MTDLAILESKLDRILALLETRKPRAANVSGRGNAIAYSDEFEVIWKLYPRRAGNVKAEAYQQFNARIRNGATSLAIKAGVERYRAFCDTTGLTNTQFVKMAQTFFGVSRHWEDEWALPVVKANGPRTDEEWEKAGLALRIHAKPGESMHEYKQRIQGAMR